MFDYTNGLKRLFRCSTCAWK